MHAKDHLRWVPVSALLLLLSACSAAVAGPTVMLPMPTAADTQTPAPTSSPAPTPTATPDQAATGQAQDFRLLIGEFNDGSDTAQLSGTYHALEDYSDSFAENLAVRVKTYGIPVDAFLLKTHITLTNASGVSSTAGCGIALNEGSGVILQQNGEVYVFYLTKLVDGGTVTHTGLLKDQTDHYGHRNNPADIDVVLLVVHDQLTLFVDGKKAMTRQEISATPIGDLDPGFVLRAGSDYEYGTRCTFTGTDLWEITED